MNIFYLIYYKVKSYLRQSRGLWPLIFIFVLILVSFLVQFDKFNISEMSAQLYTLLIALLAILFGYTTFRITALDSKRNNIILIINEISGLILHFEKNLVSNAAPVFSKISHNPKVIKLAEIIKDDTSRNNIDVLKEEIIQSAADELSFIVTDFETPYQICLLKLKIYLPISVSMFEKALNGILLDGEFFHQKNLENKLETYLKEYIQPISKRQLQFYENFKDDIPSFICSRFKRDFKGYKNDLKVRNTVYSAINFVSLYFDFFKELDSYKIEKWSGIENSLKDRSQKYLVDFNKRLLKRFKKKKDLSQMIEYYLNDN